MEIFYEYHIKKYPNIQTNDKIKLIYQATLGPNHLGKNLNYHQVLTKLKNELQETCLDNDNIYEWISEDFLRINIHKYQESNSIEQLIKWFISSTEKKTYSETVLKTELLKYLTKEQLKDYNYLPVSHTTIYKEHYLPHYLVINKDYLPIDLRVKQLLNFLQKAKNNTIISLDGKCTSGKTTISKSLEKDYTVIHIDDFFLSKERKTKERLLEIGGNIDYELVRTNLEKIKKAWVNNNPKVMIKVYDCSSNNYYEKEVILKDKIILEGVYSNHRYFRDLIDYSAYMVLDGETQNIRVNNRDMKDRFINEWIPLENKYFDDYQLEQNSDILI